MELLRQHPVDLAALVGLVAEAKGIDQVFVEKDFWVTEVLRASTVPVELVAKDDSRHPVGTIFKGGTSLSRVHGIIERFSEDVDLLIRFPAVDASTNAKDKVLKQIRDTVTSHLGLDGAAVTSEAPTKGVKRDVRYHYPRSIGLDTELVSSGVLLEMGSRGGAYPTRKHQLRSMVAEHAIDELGESAEQWMEFATVEVEVLAPERTLLEKLALLHDGAARSSSDARARDNLLKAGRHLYDVHQLLNHDEVIAALSDLGLDGITAMCADIAEQSSRAKFSFTPRPAGGYGESPLLDDRATCRDALARGYETAMTLVYGQRPSFDECMATIRARAALL